MFRLPEKEFLAKARKLNLKREFQLPKEKSRVRYGSVIAQEKFKVLTIGAQQKKTDKAILFLFGGGMIIGPDYHDIRFASETGQKSGSDVWIPYYPLCTQYSIDETYRLMLTEYQADKISFLCFSSGGALALGICLYNNEQKEKLPVPRQITDCSPGSIPYTSGEKEKMSKLAGKDIMPDSSFMAYMKDSMSHGKKLPDYLFSGICGNFSGLQQIHFFYGSDEVLSAEAEPFAECVNIVDVFFDIIYATSLFTGLRTSAV